jgi:hypothetical protein
MAIPIKKVVLASVLQTLIDLIDKNIYRLMEVEIKFVKHGK